MMLAVFLECFGTCAENAETPRTQRRRELSEVVMTFFTKALKSCQENKIVAPLLLGGRTESGESNR